MNLQLDQRSLQILDAVKALIKPGKPVYLVGGAVRDIFLGKPVKDFDLVVPSGSMELANAVRRKLNGVCFTLDDERHTARVILEHGKANELILDFVTFVGSTIEEDLKKRDFTINTLAVDLDQPDELIDPLGGSQDLQIHVLRAASEASMLLDPLRIIRGARMMLAYDLSLEPETALLMRIAIPKLVAVSGERIRDEIFKILELENRARSFRLLSDLGILDEIFPGSSALKSVPAIPPHVHPLWDHTLGTVSYLERILTWLPPSEVRNVSHTHLADVQQALKPYKQKLDQHFLKAIQGGRSRKNLFFLGAFYHDIGKPEAQHLEKDGKYHFQDHPAIGMKKVLEVGEAFRFGQAEMNYLMVLVGQHMRVHFLSKLEDGVSEKAIYRYFKQVGDIGLDIALLSLADTLATWESGLSENRWDKEMNVALELIHAWFERTQEVITPPKLIDGNDLQSELGLQPGPLLGDLLEELREAQASGEVKDKQSALEFVKFSFEQRKG